MKEKPKIAVICSCGNHLGARSPDSLMMLAKTDWYCFDCDLVWNIEGRLEGYKETAEGENN